MTHYLRYLWFKLQIVDALDVKLDKQIIATLPIKGGITLTIRVAIFGRDARSSVVTIVRAEVIATLRIGTTRRFAFYACLA
jgi:hypothetical protein